MQLTVALRRGPDPLASVLAAVIVGVGEVVARHAAWCQCHAEVGDRVPVHETCRTIGHGNAHGLRMENWQVTVIWTPSVR